MSGRFAWQPWHFQYPHRCPRKLGEWTPLLSVWRVWRFQHHGLDLCGRRGTQMPAEAWRRSGSDCRCCILRDRRGTFSISGWMNVAGMAHIQVVELDPRSLQARVFTFSSFSSGMFLIECAQVSNWASSSLYFDERTCRYHKL